MQVSCLLMESTVQIMSNKEEEVEWGGRDLYKFLMKKTA